MPVQIDWERTNAEQRALLNRAVSALRRRLGMSWEDLFLDAFGPRDRVGDRYQDNLSRGRIAPHRAFLLHGWIAKHDPVLAAEAERSVLDKLLIPEGSTGAWNQFVETVGLFTGVSVLAYKPSFGISEFSKGVQIPGLELALGEEYYFEVKAPHKGLLLCFVRYNDVWHLIPLSRSASAARCRVGTNEVPFNPDTGDIDPLVERQDRGLHEFVFFNLANEQNLVSMQSWEPRKPVPSSALRDAADELQAIADSEISVMRVNLLIS
ncbi:MAG: hypothetical protein AAF511_09080 [Pseudomonadota bacterium]